MLLLASDENKIVEHHRSSNINPLLGPEGQRPSGVPVSLRKKHGQKKTKGVVCQSGFSRETEPIGKMCVCVSVK